MEMIIKLKWYWAHWLFGKNNRQPLDNLHYVRDAPGNIHGT